MDGHLLSADGSEHEVTNEAVRQLLGSSTKFWLDLMDPEPATADALLRDTFGFHELAVEDAEKFGQRPKLDSYDDYSLLVVFGADHLGQPIEVHCFYSEQYLVTVHRGHCPDLAQLADRLRRNPPRRPDHIMLLYRVVDALIDGYFPVLGALDDRIDELEDAILQRPTEEQLGHLFDLKRTLIAMRKVVTPQRDLFATFLAREDPLPGMTPEAERYFRDLYDHLIRISDLVDSYRDLLSGALDTHLSTVSNRLNAVMKQLTIIATIFLPLSFLTGFFGQNFGWMVGKLTSLPVFLAVGVGLQLGAAVGLLVLFRRRGWLASDATAPASLPRTPRAQRTRLFRQSPATVPTDLARD